MGEQEKARLTDVPGVGEARAKKFSDAGVESVEQLSHYTPSHLAEKAGVSEKLAGEVVAAAKELVSDDQGFVARVKERFSGKEAEAEYERLKADVYALKEARKAFSDQISHLSEEIGSVRENLLSQEKKLKDFEVRVSKAADLVESVQPDQLYAQAQKQDAKIETVKGKVDANRGRLEKLVEQLKELRSDVSKVRGVDKTVELAEEADQKLVDVQKVAKQVEKRADKVEGLFADMREELRRVEKFESLTEEMKGDQEELISTINDLEDRLSHFATKEEVEEAADDAAETAEVAVSTINDLKHELASLHQRVDELASDAGGGVEERVSDVEKRQDAIGQSVSDLSEAITGLQDEIDSGDTGLAEEVERLKRIVADLLAGEERLEEEGSVVRELAEYIREHLSDRSADEVRSFLLEYDHRREDVERALRFARRDELLGSRTT